VTIWLLIIAVLAIFEVLQLTGVLRVSAIVANFYLFMFSLVTVSILAVIGAIFVGITIAHRMMGNTDFTPFEKEMLTLKEQVDRIEKMLENRLNNK